MPRDPNPDIYFRTDHLKADLKSRSVRGGAVTMATQLLKFVLNIGSTVILARLLTPKDYGLIGMATVVINFVAMFKDMGLSTATIQKAEITHKQVSTLLWINVGVSSGFMVLTAALAPALAWFYDGDSRLIWITLVLASGFIFGGLTTQHQALLSRQMRFTTLAAIDLTSMTISLMTAVIAALYGAGYWALVLMQLALRISNAAGVWLMCGWRPGPPDLKSGVGSMLAFGGNLTAYSILNYLSRNIDNLLIGKLWGAQQLGLYAKAYQLLLLPLQQINAPLGSVAVPTLSRLADSPEQFRQTYLRILEKLAMLTMPGVALMIATSDWFVSIFLGSQWTDASRIFALLGITALFQPISNSTGWLFTTQGRTSDLLRWGLIGESLGIVAIIVGLPWGAVGVATSYAISGPFLRTPLLYWYVGRAGSVRTSDLYRTIAPAACASACVIAALLAFRRWVQISDPRIGLPIAFAIALTVTFTVLAALPAGRRGLRDTKSLLAFLATTRKSAK